ncbi:MAG: DUF2231 domain-containing protein [Gemmatimonadaceae bacterium]
MESKTKLLGHPVHQIVVAFPMGLLGTAALFDAVYVVRGSGMWSMVAFYMIGAGVVGGLLAAVFGLIDYLGIPVGTRAKRIGALHGICSVTVVLAFAVSWLLRVNSPVSPAPLSLLFSFGGVAFLGLAGWLGGELLNRMGVGIDDGANLNAPSSLAGPAVFGVGPPSPKSPISTASRPTHRSGG